MTCKKIAKIHKKLALRLHSHQWYCGNDSPIQASTSNYSSIDNDANPSGKTDKFVGLAYFLKVGIHCKESALFINMAAIPL
jgi:hypothetical protein